MARANKFPKYLFTILDHFNPESKSTEQKQNFKLKREKVGILKAVTV